MNATDKILNFIDNTRLAHDRKFNLDILEKFFDLVYYNREKLEKCKRFMKILFNNLLILVDGVSDQELDHFNPCKYLTLSYPRIKDSHWFFKYDRCPRCKKVCVSLHTTKDPIMGGQEKSCLVCVR